MTDGINKPVIYRLIFLLTNCNILAHVLGNKINEYAIAGN